MIGRGTSYGAISVMNAIPCGTGSTIGIDLRTDAVFSRSDGKRVVVKDRPDMDHTLAHTCVRRAREWISAPDDGYLLEIDSRIPPSMGLKSSSSVCNAVISAVLDYYGAEKDIMDIIRLGVECAKECRVTITGAFDDACGCGLGGLVITDNSDNILIERKEIPQYDVVICIADRMIPKQKVPVERYRELHDRFRRMVPMISEDYLRVLTENGRAVGEIIGEGNDIAEKAIGYGALAAGITGTGPAIAVIAEKGDGRRISDLLGCRTILTTTR